uniref:Uncharacterized protein n=1 Tax=Meloidogyne javanica TaxID=6303 RepID=A0A915N5M0_MELJA
MNNPKTGQNFVDLKDLLANPSTYQSWVQMDSCTKYNAFQVSRSCVKNNSNKFYSGRETNNMEEICAHPKYGLVQASFERDVEFQKIDVKHPNNHCVMPKKIEPIFNFQLF